jgi:hypothetical protein
MNMGFCFRLSIPWVIKTVAIPTHRTQAVAVLLLIFLNIFTVGTINIASAMGIKYLRACAPNVNSLK